MDIKDFPSNEKIYIDSNIFIYVVLENPKYISSCKTFLEKVERGEIKAAISPLVVDEVCFKIIIEKLKSKLGIDTNSKIIQKLKEKPELINKTKPELITFLFIIENYKGLEVVSVDPHTGTKTFSNILNYNLFPRDALHLSVMDFHGIKNIATADPDFERVGEIKVWKP